MEIKSYANTQTKEEENKAWSLRRSMRFSIRKTLPRQQNTSLKDISSTGPEEDRILIDATNHFLLPSMEIADLRARCPVKSCRGWFRVLAW